jgi:hypothetical protein
MVSPLLSLSLSLSLSLYASRSGPAVATDLIGRNDAGERAARPDL